MSQVLNLSGDTFRGGMLGVFLGDALGSPHEFWYSKPVSTYTGVVYMPIELRLRNLGWKPAFGVVGQVTDDSMMATALLTSLCRDGDYNQNNVIVEYIKLINSGIKFIGNNTRALLGKITINSDATDRMIQTYKSRLAKKDMSAVQSNGSLMRALPLIWLFTRFPYDVAVAKCVEDTNITNPNDTNRLCTIIYMNFCIAAVNKTPLPELLNKIYGLISQNAAINQAYLDVINEAPRDIKPKAVKGWVVNALYCAMYAYYRIYRYGESFEVIIRRVICLGGDTDTTGAIAGGMLGLYFGETLLKANDVTANNINLILNADTTKGDFPAHIKYHPVTAMQMLSTY